MDALAPPGPGGGMAAPDLARMRATARRFEAQALGSLLGNAFATSPLAKGGFSGGEAESQWRPMLVEKYAEAWARRGGVGLADTVLREMVRLQGGGPVNTSSIPQGVK